MKTIHVPASREYDVLIERGLLDRAGEEIARVLPKARRAVIVCGERVSKLYAARLAASLSHAGLATAEFCYPGGEQYKTLDTYSRLLHFAAAQKLSRGDVIVALGGGVTGDLTGFAAATYQRGLPFVQIPTTLLAAVDSSVGGKTAVNLESGKNQVGCFYQPSLVLCDADTLSTLSEEEYRNGCAEVIKYGVLGSAEFFTALEQRPVREQLDEVIAQCVGMKRDIVAADEFDTGRRQLLNLGHSFGHAVEKCSDFRIAHGSAVAVGMAMMCRAAYKRGICDEQTLTRLKNILAAYGLPDRAEFTADELYAAALSDKKISGGSINLIVPERIGRCRIEKVPAEELRAWLADGGAL